jgi:hypothetical protein
MSHATYVSINKRICTFLRVLRRSVLTLPCTVITFHMSTDNVTLHRGQHIAKQFQVERACLALLDIVYCVGRGPTPRPGKPYRVCVCVCARVCVRVCVF